MPYINQKLKRYWRKWLDPFLEGITDKMSAGELNYIITRILHRALGPDVGYARINELMGVLTCCQLELYRRIAAPYEDSKIKENGDVYEVWDEVK